MAGPTFALLASMFRCVVCLCVLVFFFDGSIGHAQQSLFNVPSTQATASGEVFVQEQLNLGAHGVSNLTFDIGVPGGFEIGVNIFDVTLYDAASQITLTPLSLLNASYTMVPEAWMSVQVGVQAGCKSNLQRSSNDAAALGWVSARFRGGLFGDYVVGGYLGNESYLGRGMPMGLLLGIEFPLIPNQLHLMADFVSGDSEASVAVFGLVLMLPAGFQISLGLQVPSPGSSNSLAGVLELTRTPNIDEPSKDIDRSAEARDAEMAKSFLLETSGEGANAS